MNKIKKLTVRPCSDRKEVRSVNMLQYLYHISFNRINKRPKYNFVVKRFRLEHKIRLSQKVRQVINRSQRYIMSSSKLVSFEVDG